MPHPLEAKLGSLGRQARRLTLLYACARLATVVIAALVAFCLVDWLVHLRDPGLRVLSLAALVVLACWACWRFVLPAVRVRRGAVDLALRVGRRLPIDADRLASAMRFLGQREDDRYAGSAALRRAVIAQAAAELDRVNLDTALDRRPAHRAAAVAGVALVCALLLAALDPAASRLALVRLFNPWGSAQWPKQNHLAFVNPVRRLAAGQTFEVELRDTQGAGLPDDVQIHYRYASADGEPQEVTERMHAIDRLMFARKEHVTRPFAYRAVGGDDDSMPWIELEVVEPPGVEQLSVRLHYPEYTGWPSDSSDPHLRALTGTRVELSGRSTKPLRSVAVRMEDEDQIAGVVGEDGRHFHLPVAGGREFVVQRSGAYWLELTDAEGFSSGERWRYEIRAVEDTAPAVVVEEPAANLFVTAEASLPVRVAVKDDLAIHEVGLRFSRSDKSADPEAQIVVYEGPAHVSEAAAAAGPAAGGEARTFEHRFELKPLRLVAGAELTLYATATDYHPLLGQSQPRRLTIITLDELQERLAERQNSLVNELTRILKLQRDARAQVSGVEIQLRQVGQANKQDLDHLQAAELIQRQVERGLVSPSEGVVQQIAGLLDDLTNNKADSPGVERQMRSLLDEVQRLGRDELPLIAHDLTAGLKAAQAASGAQATRGAAALGPLASAGGHQQEVIETLERLTADMAQWDNYRRFHREIASLRREHEELNTEAAAVARQTLTKDLKDLDVQQQADLKKLGARQLELARRFDKIQQRMQHTIDDQAAADPMAVGAISDALTQSRERAIAGAMRQSGRQFEANQMGQAAQSQRRVTDDLQEMLDILANRREHEAGRLVKKLREAEGELAGLRQRQDGLRKKWEAAPQSAEQPSARRELERLTREQRQLGEQTQRLARRLARLQAEQAGRSAARGGDKMGQAGEQGQQGNGQAAAEQAANAKQDLEQAQRELAQRRAQAEADLAHEQIARLEDHLRGLHERQARLLDETQRYADLLASRGEWTRAETLGVGELGRNQQELAGETEAAEQGLDAAPVFQLALGDAVRQMQRAAAGLEEHHADDDVRKAQRRALDLFVHILDALKPPAHDPQQADGDAGDEGQPAAGNPPPNSGIHSLAELKLLQWMQDDVNARTQALEQSRPAGEQPSADQRREYLELSEQQGRIADLLMKLAQAGKDVDGDGAP
ncbi:MAG TPA: hypothetical protein VFW87_19580 [Pirellulales bacterium]|nr:hypothetical protein [Pirellulales bacterium]